MPIISTTTKSYIAGFLDGDGCIMFQLIHRKDYVYGYQIRASIVFYQKTVHRHHLELIKSLLRFGYLRDRGDEMTEYTIVGIKPVIEILKLLKPYIRLKKKHIILAMKIAKIIGDRSSLHRLIKASRLVDEYGMLNYSKKRINTSHVLISYLRQRNLYPRND